MQPVSGQPRGTGPVVWDGASSETLGQALGGVVGGCVDRGANNPGWLPPFPEMTQRCDLLVSARAVYRFPIARLFMEAVALRACLAADVAERAQTAIQEALTNALLHASMQIDPKLRHDLAGLTRMHNDIEHALTDHRIAAHAIFVNAIWTEGILDLEVRNGGPGFAEAASTPAWDGKDNASGRGLMILHALCDEVRFLRNGTTVRLRFLLRADVGEPS